MSTPTLRGATSNNSSGTTGTAALPSGSVAGDRAFLFMAGAWGPDPITGWDELDSGTTGGGSPLIYRALTKLLDAADISTGHINVAQTFGNGFGWALAVCEGDVSQRTLTHTATGVGDSSTTSLGSDAATTTGDLLLIFAEVRNWSSISSNIGTQQVAFGSSNGYTMQVATYEAVAGGAVSNTWSILWGGAFYGLILPLYMVDEASEPAVSAATSGTAPFDIAQTIVSQYVSSPIIGTMLANLSECIDPTANFDAFYDLIWNVDTAQGYGLDLWGRIVGVGRVLQIPIEADYLGFSEPDAWKPFGYGIFYAGDSITSNFALTDSAYRLLIMAKAALNITDGSIPAINQILLALFPTYGNCYVRDDGGMEMTYVFGATLSPVDNAIVTQSGAIPKPIGVTVTVEQP